MRRRFRTRREPADLRLNLTAMVDVTMLILTFFMVANQFASAERVEMEVPRPYDSLAQDRPLDARLTINVLYAAPDAPPVYQFGALSVGSLPELSQQLADAVRRSAHLEVIVRADRRLPYRHVRDVLALLADYGVAKFHLVAEVGSPT